ncbi:MAG TPA: FHA domain-containing protein [Actinophytocola sp.]|jgi:hypothetical protein|nr:FHA domain-containing protein [Actinophytocola sp.]
MVHDDMVALPPGHHSLAYGSDDPVPGGLLALSAAGGVRVRPVEGRSVYFGRNFEEVHVGIGVDDRRVSRRQGVLTWRAGWWRVSNTGNRPIRLPNSRWLHRGGAEVQLEPGYTPLFVPGSAAREHLLELFVVDSSPPVRTVTTWPLSADERLATVVLGQQYLLCEANPRPLNWQRATAQLAGLQPGRWRAGRLEQLMASLRVRLSGFGVRGLREVEVPEPVGDALTDNLVWELVRTGTLVPPDLALLDPE